MQSLDIVIYTVVLTTVLLASARHVFLETSNKPAEPTLVTKVINLLGFLAAIFSLFLSKAILGEVHGPILAILVFAVIAVATIAAKCRKSWDSQLEMAPIPENAISSQTPDPTLGWCGNCKAHTLPGEIIVTMHGGDPGDTTDTYRAICCGHCEARWLWNVPSEIPIVRNWMLGCAIVVGLVTAFSFTAFARWNLVGGLMIGLVSVPILICVLAMLIRFLLLRWQWCKWLSHQSHGGSFSNPPNTSSRQL